MTSSIESYQDLTKLVQAILIQYAEKKQKDRIEDYYIKIHENFYSLKTKYPTCFRRLLFNTNGHFPYSDDLDSIIQDLQIAGYVSKPNPRFSELIIRREESAFEFLKKNHMEIEEEFLDEITNHLSL
ncbi:MAG: hypothetical protein KJ607_11465 [Bacteroidetes bacterium]|nr:hypothetical protein [Bacteroidota bacterium]